MYNDVQTNISVSPYSSVKVTKKFIKQADRCRFFIPLTVTKTVTVRNSGYSKCDSKKSEHN